jgi:hypothetical protein
MGWIFKAGYVIAIAMGTISATSFSSAVTTSDEQRPAPAKEFACGQVGKPCPLQGWMRNTFAAAATRGDTDALAKGFDLLASKPPAGYPEWASTAKEGAALSRKKDIEGAKRACQNCHNKYKGKYREELRDRPL